MPQKPVTPATTKPPPTNAGMTRSQGETRAVSRVPSRTRLPAAIWTWRMIGSGALRSTTTGRPARFHACNPPASWQAWSPPARASSAAAWVVRLPLLQ